MLFIVCCFCYTELFFIKRTVRVFKTMWILVRPDNISGSKLFVMTNVSANKHTIIQPFAQNGPVVYFHLYVYV